MAFPVDWNINEQEQILSGIEELSRAGVLDSSGKFIGEKESKEGQRLKAIYDKCEKYLNDKKLKETKETVDNTRKAVAETRDLAEFLKDEHNKELLIAFLEGREPITKAEKKIREKFVDLQKQGILGKPEDGQTARAYVAKFIKDSEKKLRAYTKEKADNMEFVSEYFEHPLKFAKEHPDLTNHFKTNKDALKASYKEYKRNKKYLEKLRTSEAFRKKIMKAAGMSNDERSKFEDAIFADNADPNKIKKKVDEHIETAKARRKAAIEYWKKGVKSKIYNMTVGKVANAANMVGRKFSAYTTEVKSYITGKIDMAAINISVSTSILAQGLKDRVIDSTVGRIIK